MKNKEKVTFSEWLEDKMDNGFICGIMKGLSVSATILFGVLSVAFGFVAAFAGPPHTWNVIMFIVFGLIAGVNAGLVYYLFEEY